MSRCAYCLRDDVKLSREHLIPKSLDLLFSGGDKWGGHYFLEKAPDKFLPNQPVVKDVCVTCNNGPLSKLDSYALEFFRTNGRTSLAKESTLNVRYSWESLCRWILKVQYNSARIHEREVTLLGPCREYILGAAKPPRNLVLFAFAISDWHPDVAMQIELSKEGADSGPICGEHLRISLLRFNTKATDPKLARAVIYGSLAIVILMISRKAPHRLMTQFESDFLSAHPGAMKLNQQGQGVTLKAGEFNQLNALLGHHMIYEDAYSRWRNTSEI